MLSPRAEYPQRNSPWSFFPFVIGVLLVVCGNGHWCAANAGENPTASSVDARPAPATGAPADAKPHKAQKRDVDAIIVLLVLTLMVIVLAFAGLLIWGRRVRRVAKQPLKTVPLPDPLWYLRGRTPVADGEADRRSGADDTDPDATPR
ncbi:MAG: hypothetical protein WD065_01075 [Planctomycetaceae bacterium]